MPKASVQGTENQVVIWVKPTRRGRSLNCGWSLDQPIKKALNIEPIRGRLQPRPALEPTNRKRKGLGWNEKWRKEEGRATTRKLQGFSEISAWSLGLALGWGKIQISRPERASVIIPLSLMAATNLTCRSCSQHQDSMELIC